MTPKTPYFLDEAEAQRPAYYAQLRAGFADADANVHVSLTGASCAMFDAIYLTLEGDAHLAGGQDYVVEKLAGFEHGISRGSIMATLDHERVLRLRNALRLMADTMEKADPAHVSAPSVPRDENGKTPYYLDVSEAQEAAMYQQLGFIQAVAPDGYDEKFAVFGSSQWARQD